MRLHSFIVFAVLFTAIPATIGARAAEKTAKGSLVVEGKVSTAKKDVDSFTFIKIKTDKGDIYTLTLDDLGKQVGARFDGIRVHVVGKPSTKGDEKWLTVTQIGEGKYAVKK